MLRTGLKKPRCNRVFLMKKTPAAGIAWRYLVSKKSHSAVGAISVVSICGMAVATAAIICVLSVFNGFKGIIADRLDTLSPDIIVEPLKGKVFANADSIAKRIENIKEVEIASPTLTDNALALCGSREMPVTLKGVHLKDFRKITTLDSLIIDRAPLRNAIPDSEFYEAIFSIGAAAGISATPEDEVLLFTPIREGRVNLSNPAASFLTDSVRVTGVFRSDQSQFDENLVIVDIDLARELLQYDSEASAIEILASPGADIDRLTSEISKMIGPGFAVKDRLRQQEMNFRMISIEKWVTFLLLFFILVIASFNIISSLSMLVIEKENSISTLRAMGFSRRGIGSIFFWESIFVTILGGISGIAIGIILTLMQEHWGLIKLQGDPGTLTVASYPVHLDPADILITMMPIVIIGFATALITATYARARSRSSESV